jgi:hypothetical protein
LLHITQPHNLENKFVREGCTFDLIGHIYFLKYIRKNGIHEIARQKVRLLDEAIKRRKVSPIKSLIDHIFYKKKYFTRSLTACTSHQTIQGEKKRGGVFVF